MKNILLALLLANILYFMWGSFADSAQEHGVAVVSEADLGPLLDISPPSLSESAISVGAVLGSGRVSDLAAVVGRSCISVGPFRAATDADGVLADFESQGMRATLRTTEAPILEGHWVHVRDVPNRDAGNEVLGKLKEGGLADAYMVETEDEGLKISIGLFAEVERAERVELQAKSLGVNVIVTERTRDTTVTFVDIGLPPGRGAGGIVQRYGEERVLLRGAATCPRRG